MTRLWIFLLLIGLGPSAQSQLDQNQFSLYQINKLVFNPAYAASSEYTEAYAVHRSQWINLASTAFATQSLSFQMPLFDYNSGIGFHIVNDFVGVQRSTFAMLNYAYYIDLNNSKLSFGLSGGIIQSKLDGTRLLAPEGSYEDNFTHNDALLPETIEKGVTLDLGLGVFLSNERYFAGVSMAHVLAPKIEIATTSGTSFLNYQRNIYAMGGYTFDLSKRFSMQPSVLIKSDLHKFQIDFSNLVYYKDNIWAGASFRGYSNRSMDAVGLLFGFKITPNFMLTYNYDISMSNRKSFNNGSHEILLGYKLKLKQASKKGAVIYNPRFL